MEAWEDSYKNIKQIWGTEPDLKIIQYFNKIKKGNVLDIGIGEGRNSIPFAFSGFNIDGVDISETALSRCKKIFADLNANITLFNSDIRDYHIKKNNYNLIIAANVLNFFKRAEIDEIVQNIKAGLQEGGVLYLSVFSILDPKFIKLQENNKQVEENTFYVKERDTFIHYFTKDEIMEYFSDLKTLSIIESFEYDDSHQSPHYHGGIEYVALKQ